MMKHKICIITTAHRSYDIRIFHKEAVSLAKAGYSVTLIAPGEKDAVEKGITIVALKETKKRLVRMVITTWRAYRKALQTGARIFHFHDPELIPIGLLLKITGKKIIYDIHEDLPKQILFKEWIYQPFRVLISRVIKNIENTAIRFFDAIIAATPAIANNFNHIKRIRVHLVQNFPLLDELTSSNIRQELGYCNKLNNAVYIGGISNIRGIQEMVTAMSYLNNRYNAKLLLCGLFDQINTEERTRNLEGFDQVEYFGWLDRKQVASLLAKSKVALVLFHPLPNHIEAQPNKLFEYMSACLPVIASDFPLWKEIIEGYKCGLTVNPLDSRAIASAIEYIFENPEEAELMGQSGRIAVENIYNWDREEIKLLAIYQELTGDLHEQ